MVRTYMTQQCFGFYDDEIGEAVYDAQEVRRTIGIDLNCAAATCATTLRIFRRSLEKRSLIERDLDRNLY